MPGALERVGSGAWYSIFDPELEALHRVARVAVHEHNMLPPDERGAAGPRLAALLAGFGEGARIEAPFHCSYGPNISVGARAYLNAGCVILDSARVTIGADTMLGPYVQVYCADHHREAAERRRGMERALPVAIGRDVWVGGGAVLLPGVSVGNGAIVGAGAVVTRDVAPGARVAGVPARPI